MAYIEDTYGLRYFKDLTDFHGRVVRLEIHKKDYTGVSYEIGDLSGLRLQIGGNDDVDAPIIKTSLVFSMVDSWDAGFTPAYGGLWSIKHGHWEEFFTPDSTMYLVKLYTAEDEEATLELMWSGYITPDSLQEPLSYRGVVSFTARDNLGHLSDIPFKPNGGLKNTWDFVIEALEKISFPMDMFFAGLFHAPNDGGYTPLAADDDSHTTIGDLAFVTDPDEERTYWDVLTEILTATGTVLRYIWGNTFTWAPIRYIPDLMAKGTGTTKNVEEVEFYGGNRLYEPAFRQIVDTIDFGYTDKLEIAAKGLKSQLSGSTTETIPTVVKKTFRGVAVTVYAETPSLKVYSDATVQRNGITIQGTFLDDSEYGLAQLLNEAEGESARDYLFIPVNRGTKDSNNNPVYDDTTVEAEISIPVKDAACEIELTLAEYNVGRIFDNAYLYRLHNPLKRVSYNVRLETSGGNIYNWNGSNWEDGSAMVITRSAPTETGDRLEPKVTIKVPSCLQAPEGGTLVLSIGGIVYESYFEASGSATLQDWDGGTAEYGTFARLEGLAVKHTADKAIKSDTVTTINDEKYNVRSSRSPKYGCLPQTVSFLTPANYPGAFFYLSYGQPVLAPYQWVWYGETQETFPFPVQTHLQILQYHAVAMELLEGSMGLVDKTKSPHWTMLYLYKKLYHILLTGTLNLCTGRWESCQLRSFAEFGSDSPESTRRVFKTASEAVFKTLSDEIVIV